MKKILSGLPGLAVAWTAVGAVFVHAMYERTYYEVRLDDNTDQIRYKDAADRYPRRELFFYSGKRRLAGFVYGENESGDMIVLSHGIHSSHETYFGTIRALVDRGWMVFAFDNTGAGDSEGEDGVGLAQGPLDLHAALTFIEKDPALSKKRKFLLGHSQGGYAVCAVLNFKHEIAGVVSLSGFATPYEMEKEYGTRLFGKSTMLLYPFLLIAEFRRFGFLRSLSAVDGINGTDITVLIAHARKDSIVDFYGSGLISHKSKITNPNVRYMPLAYKEREDHENFFYSLEGNREVVKNQKAMDALLRKYAKTEIKELPKKVRDDFFSHVDKEKASEYNADFFDKIDAYLCEIGDIKK